MLFRPWKKMKNILPLVLHCFVLTNAYLRFDPQKFTGRKSRPITPFHGLRFLNHRPESNYRSIPIVSWLKDVNNITPYEVQRLKDSVIKYGVVKCPNQRLTRKQQITLSEKLGEAIITPKAFGGGEIHPEFPNLVPVRNYWSNGTWKGKSHSFGEEWHKDGDYFPFEKGYIFTLMYADNIDEGIVGGETAFINSCQLRHLLPHDIEKELEEAVIPLNVWDIPEFRGETDDVMNAFKQAYHKVIFNHPDKDEECIFLLFPGNMRNATNSILRLWDFMQNPKYVMQQKWKTGDIVIWDNFGTFHRAMPFVNKEKKRIMYRTQIRLSVREKN